MDIEQRLKGIDDRLTEITVALKGNGFGAQRGLVSRVDNLETDADVCQSERGRAKAAMYGIGVGAGVGSGSMIAIIQALLR